MSWAERDRIARAASSVIRVDAGLAGVDGFPRDPETGGKPALREAELFADCFVFGGDHRGRDS
jgi:hypothetical protein